MQGTIVNVYEISQFYSIRTDHIGRPVFATDGAGAKVWEASYLPFGGKYMITQVSSVDINPQLEFPGQWFQSETGLHQNWMRDYDPTTGRYMQADPLGLVDGASVYGYVCDGRPWAGQSPPCAWYQFTVDRKGAHPENHLSSYKGWVHADGYSGFDGVFGDDKASEMACVAHVRRKFVNVFDAQGSSIAEEAIKRIAKLYAVEKEARGKPPEERAAHRQANATSIFDDLEEWLHAQLPKISGKSPLAKAIRYALGRMPKARPYLNNGHPKASNNTAERAVKPVAIGRKKTGCLRDLLATANPWL